MKTIFLLLFYMAFRPCVAQDSLSLLKKQLQQFYQTTLLAEPRDGNRNDIINYLEAENRKKIFSRIFNDHRKINTPKPVACCQQSAAFFTINKAWLHYNMMSSTSDQKLNSITNLAGEVLDTFLGEYSVQNKRNF